MERSKKKATSSETSSSRASKYNIDSDDSDLPDLYMDVDNEQRKNAQKRKRELASKNLDDWEDEEDEDDDDEVEARASKSLKKKSRQKKKQKSLNPFLELEAEVDDEEDEEEDEDYEDIDFIEKDDVSHADAKSDLLSGALSRRELDRRFVEQSDEQLLELAKDMDRRYKRTAYRPFRGDMAKTQQSLLPSVSDTKLWMVRCREGKEKTVVMTLMRKFFECNRQAMANKGVQVLKIHSVFCRDDLKGFIYVEADMEQHVQDALKSVFGVYLGKTRMVPVKEMVDVLTIQKDTQTVDVLKIEWVRVKRGKYAGDLARVVDITNTGDICTIQLIPRLDFLVDNKDKKKKKQGLQSRAPQKLFNPRDLPPNLSRMVTKSHRGYWMLGPEAFKNGLLEKSVRVSALDTECKPPPTLDEINAFSGSEGTIDRNTLQALKSSIANRENTLHFRPGDQVLVVGGELANVPAVVSGITGNLATIQALVPGMATKTVLPVSQLSKRFSVGDTVKVLTGKHEGDVGTIVRLQGHLATLVSTGDQQEIHVTTRDLQDVKEVTTNMAGGAGSKDLGKSSSLALPTAANNPAATAAKMMLGRNTGRPRYMDEPPRRFPRPSRPREDLLGATVKILGGSFKGYLGVVKHISDQHARVELHTNCNTVTVLKDKLIKVDSDSFSVPHHYPSNRTPSIANTPSFNSAAASQTPNPYSSAHTPNPYSSAQTPNPHGERAFGSDAVRTPAWDAGSRTPHVEGSDAWATEDPNPAAANAWSAGTSGAWPKEPSSVQWSSAAGTGNEWGASSGTGNDWGASTSTGNEWAPSAGTGSEWGASAGTGNDWKSTPSLLATTTNVWGSTPQLGSSTSGNDNKWPSEPASKEWKSGGA